jgi:hypothetical protein
MMKPFFMLPGEPFNFCRDHFHFKVSMEVGVPNVPGRYGRFGEEERNFVPLAGINPRRCHYTDGTWYHGEINCFNSLLQTREAYSLFNEVVYLVWKPNSLNAYFSPVAVRMCGTSSLLFARE